MTGKVGKKTFIRVLDLNDVLIVAEIARIVGENSDQSGNVFVFHVVMVSILTAPTILCMRHVLCSYYIATLSRRLGLIQY